MANARHQQTKKSYQQKDRTKNVAKTVPNGSPPSPGRSAFATEPLRTLKVEPCLSNPNIDRIEVGTRAIEAVEALAAKLSSDMDQPPPLHFERSYRLKCRTAKAVLVVQKVSASTATSGTSALAVPQLPEVQPNSSISSSDQHVALEKPTEVTDDLIEDSVPDEIPLNSEADNDIDTDIEVDADADTLEFENDQDDGDAWSMAVDSKLNELLETAKSFERERLEIEALRENLKHAIDTAESCLTSDEGMERIQLLEAQLAEACSIADDANGQVESLEIQLADACLDSDDRNARIQSLETQLADVRSNLDGGKARITELEIQLIEVQQSNAKVSTMLLHSRTEYQELLAFIEAEAVEEGQSQAELKTIAQRVLEKTDAREMELGLEVSQLNDQIQFLQSELSEANATKSHSNSDESELRIQVEQLRSQLLEARHEAVELRMQSNDLGSRLAKFQGASSGQKSETLTWEQRKEALLQQLEAETHAETPCDPRKVLEIEKIIEQTNSELERRDQEIADLKTLIEQQSIAHDGMSIGVAAIAEMIESDSLIISERMRLKELRDEWEQKQRQAEIEMSMERAKLARERLELQEKTRNYNDDNPPQTAEEIKATKAHTRGRWLARLGLRDE